MGCSYAQSLPLFLPLLEGEPVSFRSHSVTRREESSRLPSSSRKPYQHESHRAWYPFNATIRVRSWRFPSPFDIRAPFPSLHHPPSFRTLHAQSFVLLLDPRPGCLPILPTTFPPKKDVPVPLLDSAPPRPHRLDELKTGQRPLLP
jgi:hypothetical protein